jgi:hypothetical protein
MATSSVWTPPADDCTVTESGGRKPSGRGALKAPAVMVPPSGPTTVRAGPGTSWSVETAATLRTFVSVSYVALVMWTASWRPALAVLTGLLVMFVTAMLAGGMAVAGISTCAT